MNTTTERKNAFSCSIGTCRRSTRMGSNFFCTRQDDPKTARERYEQHIEESHPRTFKQMQQRRQQTTN